jgi:hypothetical protein
MPTITFRRASNIQNIPITDGQIIFDTARNIILMDNGNVRNQYAGATQLISTTPEATSTNAFNAQASTQLFLQKTTVIDTKANALAVNQNYIPLGCLAFKEALGTTNYANVGNGTISGALVTLNNKSNQLDSKLNNQLSANNNEFYFDYQNGKYGYNTDPNRGADSFRPFSSGPVNSNYTRINTTTISEKGMYFIYASYSWIDRINWSASVTIRVNGTAIPLLTTSGGSGSRDVANLETEYFKCVVGMTFVELNVGDIVTATGQGGWDGTYNISPTIWKYQA